MGNTLHFIHRVDLNNCGDMETCPLHHYFDYFRQYQLLCHDIRYPEFDRIDKDDVVILGGGGLLNYNEWLNRNINRILDTGAKVIAWAPGFNTHTEYSKTYGTEIRFDQFAALTVRDCGNDRGFEYMPDVTCKLPGLREHYEIRRKYGIAQHKDYPITDFDFECITNRASVNEILRFIGETEVVLSNSYHMLLWAMYMGKKTICVNPFSTRFYSFRYKPVYFESGRGGLEAAVAQADQYHILDECIAQNDAFFERACRIIEEKLTPVKEGQQYYMNLAEHAAARAELKGQQLRPGDGFASQLFSDDGSGFSEERKYASIGLVFGDPEHHASFEIPDEVSAQQLRFDPIEGMYIRCRILSARDASGRVLQPVPQTAVSENGWDRFLTTDPQYLIRNPAAGKIEIVFRMEIMERFEGEQQISALFKQNSELQSSLNRIYSSRSWKLAKRLTACGQFIKGRNK